jgi:hypothetical protein
MTVKPTQIDTVHYYSIFPDIKCQWSIIKTTRYHLRQTGELLQNTLGQALLFDLTLSPPREINFTPTASGLAIAMCGHV